MIEMAILPTAMMLAMTKLLNSIWLTGSRVVPLCRRTVSCNRSAEQRAGVTASGRWRSRLLVRRADEAQIDREGDDGDAHEQDR